MNAESYLRSKRITVSLAVTRRVWAELTRTPQASYRTIGRRIGRHASHVRYAAEMLIAAGYVERAPGCKGTGRVVVPFYLSEYDNADDSFHL